MIVTFVNLASTAEAKSRGTGPAEPSEFDQIACSTENAGDPVSLHAAPIGVPRHTLPAPSLSRWTSSLAHWPFTPFRSTTGNELIGTDRTDTPLVVTTAFDDELQLLTSSG